MKNKNTIKKIIALLLALILVLSAFAGCKKKDKKDTPTEPESQTEDQEIADIFNDEDETSKDTLENETATEDESKKDDEKTSENAKDDSTQRADANAAAPNKSMSKQEAVVALNEATAKAAKMSYHWNRVCAYTPTGSIDVGSDSFKNILNKIINSIAKGEDIDSVMGDFLGVGTLQGEVKNGKCAPQMDGYKPYLLKGMSLTTADIKNFRAQGDTYYFNLKDCINPEANGKNALNHMTDDFTTPQAMTDLVEGNSGGLIKIDKEKSRSEFKSIILKATIKNGELVNLEFSYRMGANPIVLKAGATITGRGEVKVTETYSNFR